MKIVADIVTEAITQAFETMAFMMVLPMGEEMEIPSETVWTEIEFSGAQQGRMEVLSGPELGRMMVQNMGCLFEPTEEEIMDAWQELCNVTCGLVIPEVADAPHDVYDVSIPSVQWNPGTPSWENFTANPSCCVLNVEGYAVAVRLVLETK